MSAVTATVQTVVIERGDDDARATAVGNLKRATVYIDNGGTAVAGGTDTLDCNLATAIQNSVRNGKTVTVRTVAVSQALTTQTTAGVEVTHAGSMTLSTNTISITPKSDGYLTGSTNSTITASLDIVRPYGVFVAYTEA
jgi:hypothetical protein